MESLYLMPCALHLIACIDWRYVSRHAQLEAITMCLYLVNFSGYVF